MQPGAKRFRAYAGRQLNLSLNKTSNNLKTGDRWCTMKE